MEIHMYTADPYGDERWPFPVLWVPVPFLWDCGQWKRWCRCFVSVAELLVHCYVYASIWRGLDVLINEPYIHFTEKLGLRVTLFMCCRTQSGKNRWQANATDVTDWESPRREWTCMHFQWFIRSCWPIKGLGLGDTGDTRCHRSVTLNRHSANRFSGLCDTIL